MKKFLESGLKVLLYSTFFIPFLFPLASFTFPFIVPKILLFRSVVEVMLGVYILLLFINWERYKPRLNAVGLALGLFVLSFGVSTVFGIDPYHSFWDNHERMLGLFTILHYGIYFIITSVVFTSWIEWQKAFKIFLVAGSLVMFVGFLQSFKPFSELLLNGGNPRVASTLGNPIYVAGYGLFLAFVAVLLLSKETVRSWKIGEAGMGFLGVIGIFVSGTRGTLLALTVGGVYAAVLYALFLKQMPRVRKGIATVLGALIILGGLTLGFRQTEFVQKIPGVGRLVNTSLQSIVESPRFIAWQIAWDGMKARPVFGWGPNNYFYIFNEYYNPRSLEFGYSETWFDNAHNIFMNTLAVQGITGLAAYLAIFVAGFMMLFKAYRAKLIDLHVMVIGTAFLLAHLVHNTTVFENPTSYLYFMVWLGFVVSSCRVSDDSKKQGVDKKVGNGLVIGVGVAIVIFIVVFNLQPARANNYGLKAIHSLRFVPSSAVAGTLSESDAQLARQVIKNSLPEIQKAFEFNSPHIDDIRIDVSRAVTEVMGRYGSYLDPDQVAELASVTQSALAENIKLHPLDIRNHLVSAEGLQSRAMIEKNPLYLSQAEARYEEALKISPRRQQILYTLSFVKLQLNKGEEGLPLLEQALRDNPRIPESYWRLAYMYKATNHIDKAKAVLEEAKKNGIKFSESEQAIIDTQILVAPVSTSTPAR